MANYQLNHHNLKRTQPLRVFIVATIEIIALRTSYKSCIYPLLCLSLSLHENR